MPQRPPAKQAAPAVILAPLNGGIDGYTDPTQAPFNRWATAVNVLTGAFGYIQRCRFANVVSPNPLTGQPFTSMKFFALPGLSSYLLADIAGFLYSYDTGASYAQTQRLNPYVDPLGLGSAQLDGPWSREFLENIVYEMNGQVKQAGRLANAATIEGWGLDAPDVTPQISLQAGTSVAITTIARTNGTVTATLASPFTAPTPGIAAPLFNVLNVTDATFDGSYAMTSGNGTATITWAQLGQNSTSSGGTVDTNITKAVGRSYAYAWENANKAHIGAPSPSTQFIAYNNQFGQIDCIESGGVSVTTGSNIVTGTNTSFTSAWVGRHLWVSSLGVVVGDQGRIISVTNATTMTLATPATLTASNLLWQIFDPQATHIRLYETADGGATYFRTQRNVWVPTAGALAPAGLQFFDSANAEPPNFPFTTETSQVFNLPPPVGAFVNEYQGVLCVYGIPGAAQSFFYSNQTSTTIGLQQESFAPLNQISLPIQNGQMNGMLQFPGAAVIWSNKQDMFRLSGLLTDNTVQGIPAANVAAQQGATISRLPYALGCASPFAAAITPLGGFWLTPNAEVWLYTDTYAPKNVGRPVQDILNSIAPASIGLARMKYYHAGTRNWLALSVPANGATYNNTVLVLDLDLLASNGSPSYFTFDMATNAPAWFVFEPGTVGTGQITTFITSISYAGSFAAQALLVVGSTAGLSTGEAITITGNSNPIFNGTFVISAIIGMTELQVFFGLAMAESGTGGSLNYNPGNTPAWVPRCDCLEHVYEASGFVRLLTGQVDLIQDIDAISGGFGTEIPVPNGTITTHAWGNDSAFVIKRPGFVRFTTNRDPSMLASDGWSFAVSGIDDDFYTFFAPLTLVLIPGMNDSSSLGGNPDFLGGLAFRHSPELYKIGGVNFVMGRRLKFTINFPSGVGIDYQLRSIQLGFDANPPS
jgi:hypothetical protein